MKILEQLSYIKNFEFVHSNNAHNSEWEAEGYGTVETELKELTLLIHEKGKLKTVFNKEINCENTYRLIWNKEDNSISLEHLRFGENHPVFLFTLKEAQPYTWKSAHSHYCDLDLYDAELIISDDKILLNWTVTHQTDKNKLEKKLTTYTF